jgi:hypothetical protein
MVYLDQKGNGYGLNEMSFTGQTVSSNYMSELKTKKEH